MIDVQYNKDGIKVVIGEISKVIPQKKFPLKLSITKYVSGEIIWSTLTGDFSWATFPDTDMKNITIHDSEGNLIFDYRWDVFSHGSFFYKSLWLYCKKIINEGRQPQGLSLGTHDGEFGEWVPVATQYMSDIILVEGSQKQFQKLKTNFDGQKNLELKNLVVSTDGGKVNFFEGGEGYTNSLDERVIRSWEKEEIFVSEKESISFNSLIEQSEKKFDWFHLDVEGMDAKLLMSLRNKNIPNLIIFEDNNLSNEDRLAIDLWKEKNGFSSYSERGICLITR